MIIALCSFKFIPLLLTCSSIARIDISSVTELSWRLSKLRYRHWHFSNRMLVDWKLYSSVCFQGQFKYSSDPVNLQFLQWLFVICIIHHTIWCNLLQYIIITAKSCKPTIDPRTSPNVTSTSATSALGCWTIYIPEPSLMSLVLVQLYTGILDYVNPKNLPWCHQY